MFRTTIKDLAARKLRLLTTSLAVLLGVAFMSGTLVLTDTIGQTFDGLFADANAGTDAYVRSQTAIDDPEVGSERPRLDAAVVDDVAAVEGVAAAEPVIEAYAQIVDRAGEPIGDPATGAPTYGGIWAADDRLNPFDLASGRPPGAADEVVIDRGSAEDAGYRVGDPAEILTASGRHAVTVVGIATFAGADSPGGASYALLTPAAAQELLTEPGRIDAVRAVAAEGVADDELVRRIAAAVPDGTEVLTGAEITAEDQGEVEASLGFFNTFMVTFALIALFVGSFIIYNSFSILVAQRTRHMALLRAIGASRRQVLASVLLEAVVVGLVASAVGLLAGLGVASLLQSLLGALGFDVPATGTVVTSGTVIVSVLAGLGVSVVSALLPARRASRVAPIAALRDVALDGSGSSRGRALAGAALVALGALAMASGLAGDAGVAVVGLGAGIVFVGVAVLGPILARPLSRILGAPVARLRGMPGDLARLNAMRNPKRTSATAAALMVGVALVGAITILASSTKASIDSALDEAFTGDLVVDSGSFGTGGLPPELAADIAARPEVEAAAGVRTTAAEVDGTSTTLIGIDPASAEAVFDLGVVDGGLDDLGATGLAVHEDVAEANGWRVGDTVPVTFAETGAQTFTVAATYSDRDLLGDHVIGHDAFEANVADQLDLRIFVQLDPSADVAAATAAVERVAAAHPVAEVEDATAYKESQAAQVDQMLTLIYALLGLAVVIALLGIANTLALSIFERTRELGLLRAVGMTRRQLRSTVRWEAVVIALMGTTLGLVVGTTFGWAIVQALASEGLRTFTIPVAQMAVVVLIGALAGVAAAILPARRASRLDVLGAIASS